MRQAVQTLCRKGCLRQSGTEVPRYGITLRAAMRRAAQFELPCYGNLRRRRKNAMNEHNGLPENGRSDELEQVNAKLRELVDVDRRVISRKQTIGYMLFDGSNGFNIDGHKDLFTDSILKISFDYQSINSVVGGVWDVVDDFIVSFVIEKTRTRWGKFIP